MVKATEKEVDNILSGLTGDLLLGQKYYIFTVTYAYIGVVGKVTERCITLDDAHIVSNAGSADDAVTQIVNGKAKPQSWEKVGKPIIIFSQAITAAIPF